MKYTSKDDILYNSLQLFQRLDVNVLEICKALVCARFQIKSLVFEFPNSYFLIRYLILLEPFQEHFPSLWLLTLQMKLTLARVEWTLNKFDFDLYFCIFPNTITE